MNGFYYYSNSGAILRRLFPKQLNTQALILFWTVVFILNIIIVVLVQNFMIYKITDFSEEGVQKLSYFNDCEIEDVNYYYVTYVNENGNTRVVCLDRFPVNMFQRARLMKSTDMPVLKDGIVQYKDNNEVINVSIQEYVELANPDSVIDILLQTNAIQKLAWIYIAIGVGMLLIEFFIYSVFHKLFRE